MSVESEWLGKARELKASADLGDEPAETRSRRLGLLYDFRLDEIALADQVERELMAPKLRIARPVQFP